MVHGIHGNFTKVWAPQTHGELCSYPTLINILEGEHVEIPVPYQDMINENYVSLIRSTSNSKVVENCYGKIKFIKEDGFSFGAIRIEGLEAGHYNIRIKETNRTIPLRVHRGVYWETDSFILKQHSLVEQRDSHNFIRMKDLKIEEVKDTAKSKLSFKLKNYKENPRVHVFGFTFLPNYTHEMYDIM